MRQLTRSLTTAVALFLGACHGATRSDRNPDTKDIAIRPEVPLRILVVVDQTSSMYDSGVFLPDSDSLRAILPRLEENGGELAVGVVRGGGGFPLRRLFVPAPPERPARAPLAGNIFEAAHARQRQIAEQASYEALHRAWLERVRRKETAFLSTIDRFIAIRHTRRTDIRSAVLRANLFFSESTPLDPRRKRGDLRDRWQGQRERLGARIKIRAGSTRCELTRLF